MLRLRALLMASTILGVASTAAIAGEIEFGSVPAPTDDAAKRQVVVSSTIKIDGTEHAVRWNTLARSGQDIGGTKFAVITDASGTPLFNKDGTPSVSDSADFTSLLPIGQKLYSVTHFETRPAAMYLSELSQAADGTLTAISTRPIDFSSVGGLWNPCAGSVTAWNTHLGSEEYSPDARSIDGATSYSDIDKTVPPMAKYLGVNTDIAPLAAFKAAFQPYKYGFPVEV